VSAAYPKFTSMPAAGCCWFSTRATPETRQTHDQPRDASRDDSEEQAIEQDTRECGNWRYTSADTRLGKFRALAQAVNCTQRADACQREECGQQSSPVYHQPDHRGTRLDGDCLRYSQATYTVASPGSTRGASLPEIRASIEPSPGQLDGNINECRHITLRCRLRRAM